MNYPTDFTFYCKLKKEPGTTNKDDIIRCIQNMFNLSKDYNCIDNIKFNVRLNCAFVKVSKEIEETIEKKNLNTILYTDNDTNIIVYPYYTINEIKERTSPNKKLGNEQFKQYLETEINSSPSKKRCFDNIDESLVLSKYFENDMFKSKSNKKFVGVDVFKLNNNIKDIFDIKNNPKSQTLEVNVLNSNSNYIDVKTDSDSKIQIRRSIYEEIERLDTDLYLSKINAESIKKMYDDVLNEISKLEELKQNKINEMTKLF